MTSRQIYDGSNGDATKALYAKLEAIGPAGHMAMNLFRASKCSARAKLYRGGNRDGSFKRQAYDRKNYSIANLCAILSKHAAALGIRWGWRKDEARQMHEWVLYIDAPTGQCSFHSAARGLGPDYTNPWDGQRRTHNRIIEWVEILLNETRSGDACDLSPDPAHADSEHGRIFPMDRPRAPERSPDLFG